MHEHSNSRRVAAWNFTGLADALSSNIWTKVLKHTTVLAIGSFMLASTVFAIPNEAAANPGDEIGSPFTLGSSADPPVNEDDNGPMLYRATNGRFFGLIDLGETGDTLKQGKLIYILANRKVQVREFTSSGRTVRAFAKSSIGRGITMGRPGELWQFKGPYPIGAHTLVVFGSTDGLTDVNTGRPSEPGEAIIAFDARSGRLDSGFGKRGLLIRRTSTLHRPRFVPHALLPQGNEGLLECGGLHHKGFRSESGYLRALSISGKPRSTFPGGIVLMDPTAANPYRECVAITTDQFGRIYTAGTESAEPYATATKAWIRRYGANGSLDTSFGNAGELQMDSALAATNTPSFYPYALHVTDSGTVNLAGRVGADSAALFTLTADGQLDATYGDSGVKLIPKFYLTDVAFDASGGAVVTGVDRTSGMHAFLGRLLANGQWDASFGDSGRLIFTGPKSYFSQVIESGSTAYVWGLRSYKAAGQNTSESRYVISRFAL